MYNESYDALPSFTLTDTDLNYLKETGRWARFLGILGFVFTGLMSLVALAMGSIMSMMSGKMAPNAMGNMSAGVLTIVYLLVAALYFFPSLYCYRYGKHLGDALRDEDSAALTSALANGKSLFKFFGVMMMIVLGFYGLLLVGFMIGGAFMASRGH